MHKKDLTILFFLILFACTSRAPDVSLSMNPELATSVTELTASQVISKIKSQVTVPWGGGPIDTLKTGHPDNKITGIATTFMATMEVIQKARERGLNMIITHEPTFYNHMDDKSILKDDHVQAAKLKFISDHDITIWRFHDYWHQTRPDGINVGLVRALGWETFGDADNMIFDLPEISVDSLARQISKNFNTTTVRVVGSPDQLLNKVGVVPGAYGSIVQIEMLNRPGVDALVVGESREWETVEYARDMNALGMEKALIVMGHADSEDPGMEYCAEWLRTFIDEVPIEFIPAGNPLWSPDQPQDSNKN